MENFDYGFKGGEARENVTTRWSDKEGKVLGVDQFEGQLNWNERLGRFVLKAELAEFERAMKERFFTKMPKITVSVYSFAERLAWRGDTIWEMLPEGGELVGEISCLTEERAENRVTTSGMKLIVDAELGSK